MASWKVKGAILAQFSKKNIQTGEMEKVARSWVPVDAEINDCDGQQDAIRALEKYMVKYVQGLSPNPHYDSTEYMTAVYNCIPIDGPVFRVEEEELPPNFIPSNGGY